MTDNTNPGNFANRSKEEVKSMFTVRLLLCFAIILTWKDIASKGGQSSHSGGFASMDADKQVRLCFLSKFNNWLTICSVRLPAREERPHQDRLSLVVRKLPRLGGKAGRSRRLRCRWNEMKFHLSRVLVYWLQK
jgi:hypothetical protein